jgi:hypothetical protein
VSGRLAAFLALLAVLAAIAATSAQGTLFHYTFFESPSRNLGCVILDGTARCDIIVRSWTPPARPSACPHIVDFGQGLEVARGGPARFVCAGDTSLDPHAPILAYGQRTARRSLECTSRITGMTCRSSRSGHGFFISRQGYRLF